MVDYRNMHDVAMHIFNFFGCCDIYMPEEVADLAERISIEANAYCHEHGFPEFIHGTKITLDGEGLDSFVNIDFTTPDSNQMHRCVLTSSKEVFFSE